MHGQNLTLKNSISFKGCHDWDKTVEKMNESKNVIFTQDDDESVIDIAKRMIHRLSQGAAKQ